MSSLQDTEYRNLLVTDDGSAARIVLNRPEKRNALSLELMDEMIAAEGTRFATPGVNIGLFCSTPMVPVSRAIGRKHAMQMLLTGEPISAETALDWGLVNRVVPADELELAITELVAAIAKSSAYTVATGKRAFYTQIDRAETDAYEYCATVMTENAVAHDAQEGMSAFLEKRPPVWRGE